MNWWLLTQGTRVLLLMQTLWDCFKRLSLFYGLVWLPGQSLIFTNISTPLWIYGGNGNHHIGLWILTGDVKDFASQTEVNIDKSWLQNIDWSSAWARDNAIIWVCLCWTQVPVEETSPLAFISHFGSPRFSLVLDLSSPSGCWLKLKPTFLATERESLSRDI